MNVVYCRLNVDFDYCVLWDTVNCSESNNIFNPIEFSKFQGIVWLIQINKSSI